MLEESGRHEVILDRLTMFINIERKEHDSHDMVAVARQVIEIS